MDRVDPSQVLEQLARKVHGAAYAGGAVVEPARPLFQEGDERVEVARFDVGVRDKHEVVDAHHGHGLE
ncbi:MAG TPA: hypothetical protein VE686_05170, partial [Beijerinckiaceae bacterium]|nr:hypothetical protein [Beijerinckiaceae bacterium]